MGQEYSRFQLCQWEKCGVLWYLHSEWCCWVGLLVYINSRPEKSSSDPVPAVPAIPGLLELGVEVLGNPDGTIPRVFLAFLTHSLNPGVRVRTWFGPTVVINTPAAN